MSELPTHLLRPWWLLALLALPALWWAWRRHASADTPWKRLVDPHLLPSLLQEASAARRSVLWLFGVGYALAVVALAGPAWKQPLALYAPRAPLVVVQDMSSHMLVADMPPSRLLRARLKVQQLIALRKGGQIGLVAYAGDAFTVAPLSDDAHSLSDLVVALTPDTMPVDGQRADRGLRMASDLLAQAGFAKGTILLISDSADADAIAAARNAHARGYDVDVLGIGTASGAPLPTADGTFAQDAAGSMRIARLDAPALQSLAQAGGGRYAELGTASDDLAALDVLDPRTTDAVSGVADDALGWRDGGPFLLLLLLPLAACGFRRGWLTIALLAFVALPVQHAWAAEPPAWDGLWQRADQRADRALRAGDAKAALALAQTPDQRAAAAYRKGDYAAAASGWGSLDSADANYNRGNALAQMQRFPEAIDAYERALRLRPGMADAQANIAIVKRLQKHDQEPNKDRQQDRQQGQQQPNPQQAQRKPDQQGQSSNQENMQQSQQPAEQKGQQRDSPQPDRKSPQQQGGSQQLDASQKAPDRKQQAQADVAEQRALQQALLARKDKQAGDRRAALEAKETTAQREQREATEVLLNRVPDDAGTLLQRKFALEYARRQQEGGK